MSVSYEWTPNNLMNMLVIKPSSLGDVIHALPFLKAVKDRYPDALIDWVISRNLKGLLEDNPLINELILLNKDAWKRIKHLPGTLSEIAALKKSLSSRRYDMVIDLQGLLRSGLIGYVTPAATKIGFQDAREGSRFFYDRKVEVKESLHAVDKCLAVAEAIGAGTEKPEFPLHISGAARGTVKTLLGDTGEYIVFVPSARWLSKRWPAENFAALINKLPIPCVITGSRSDRALGRTIQKSAQKGDCRKEAAPEEKADPHNTIIDLCGKTDLKELIALIAGAKAVVSNDSGPMHIAAALNVPTVAIFGPTDPHKTGPYGWQNNSRLKVVRNEVPCGPCRKKKCDDLSCMHTVTVTMVFAALQSFL